METDFDRVVYSGIHVGKTSRELFMAKVTVNKTGCWLWSGRVLPNGYGMLVRQRKSHLAHRYAYQMIIGDIPTGAELDHKCRNRACCNPAHLEPVTRHENIMRGVGPMLTRKRRNATRCRNGHERTAESIQLTKDGRQKCLICEQAWKRRRRRAV